MSNLHRFVVRACKECPDDMLVKAIADWLMSPARFRFRDAEITPREKQYPGTCLLCGHKTRDAFVLVSNGEVRGVSPTSDHFPRFLEAWRATESVGDYTDTAGRVWHMHPVFFCERASQGPTKAEPKRRCLFTEAQNELHRRERESAKRKAEAAKNEPVKGAKTKTSL